MFNSLLLKVGVGVFSIGTIAGTSAAGVVYRKEISDFVSSLSKKDEKKSNKNKTKVLPPRTKKPFKSVATIFHEYLVVASYVESKPEKIAPGHLYAATKKFKCTKDSTIDEMCEIYSLDVKSDKKIINLKTSNIGTSVRSTLVKDTYYRMKINKSIAPTFNGTYEIELQYEDGYVEDEENKGKSFGRVKVLAKINHDSLTSDNKVIIAKVKSTNIVDETIDNYQCQVGTSKESLDCDIYKFTPDLTDISSATLTTSPVKVEKNLRDDLKINSYYIIDFSNESNSSKCSDLNENNLKNTIVFAKTSDDADNSKKVEFTEAQSLVGKYKEKDNNNQAFIFYAKKT